jgi:multiple sugar transport system permease protein
MVVNLAPTGPVTVVASVITGVQGGYQEAQIGYASAVSWVLFTVIFAITLANWKFGSREVAD